jgi:epoxyqueuosine reductase
MSGQGEERRKREGRPADTSGDEGAARVRRTDGDLPPRVEARARELGFSLFGVAAPHASTHTPLYRRWLEDGFHGQMAYLGREDSIARRADLQRTMDSVRSVVVVGYEYYAEDDPAVAADPGRGIVARYARGDDYHDVVKEKLEELLAWLDAQVPGGVRGRPYVDTGPILERDLARRAGLGWFGKNTMLIDPKRGSYFFLGLLLTDLDLEPSDAFEEDRCGSCSACLEACPTGALLGRDANGAPIMDARRCISYLTIELRGTIPRELRPAIGNRVYGCDICQEICPWNQRFASPSPEPAWGPRPGMHAPGLVELLETALDESRWHVFSRRSPVRRAGRVGFARNVCVGLGNSGLPEAVPVLASALSDPEPVVRAHAAWALGRIGTAQARASLSARQAVESDPEVLGELREALAG